MIKIVFPDFFRLSNLFFIVSMLATSRPLIGSNKMIILGSSFKHLARIMRCNCPPERFLQGEKIEALMFSSFSIEETKASLSFSSISLVFV